MSSIKKYSFVSPGVQIKELDQSQLPRLADQIGPVVIGRSLKGPALIPTKVNDYSEFVETFGLPVRGAGTGDIWRDGNTTSPTYGAYAAEAYLKNSRPLTFIRLLGSESDDPTSATTAQAGWTTENTSADPTNSLNGGAVGLWVIPSGSSFAANVTGALAAVFYLDKGAIRLVGDDLSGSSVGTEGAATMVTNIGSSYEFRMVIEDESGAVTKDTAFNFNPNSAKYIRKVFNTNPTLVNDEVTPAASLENYFLGETYESHLKAVVNENSGNIAGNVVGFVAAIENNTVNKADYKGIEATAAKTGWVIGQDLNTITGSYAADQMPQLFRFVVNKGDGSGEYEQNNVKISITDIQASLSTYDRYGTFTVEIRSIDDTDNAKEILEVYPQCNLNPNSLNYIARKIGDKNVAWDKTQLRHREYGDFPNASNLVRVEVNPVIEQGGLEPELLPFGFFGPTRFAPITLASGSTVSATSMMAGSGSMPDVAANGGGGTIITNGVPDLNASLLFPSMQMRVSSSDAGVLSNSDAYFGIITQKIGAQKFDEDVRDLVRIKPDGVDSHIAGSLTEYQFVFSLDDIVPVSGSSVKSFWMSGSRASGISQTAIFAAASGSTEGYKSVLNRGHNKFTMPIFGGFDGLDITERDPFRNSFLTKGGAAQDANYAVATLRRAIDSFRDPEVADLNIATVPGVTVPGITNHLISTVEKRADALAIIDLEGGYTPSHENTSAESARLGSVDATITALKARAMNTSYACAYYPWVRVNDSQTGFPLWMPPSVVALGTMASSQEKSEVWFAPAGFNRGGLTEGSAGIQVTDVRERLTKPQRDKLYEIGINPIASFPSEGIVIFGQKTLQATPSAIDRINVRRLLIHLKKEIAKISSRVLFDQNLQVTWSRFYGKVKPFLENVQTNFGLSDFRVILDETTTTADLVDRNIMYAKIFLKPARAIEFIALDFIVARTGASFEDL